MHTEEIQNISGQEGNLQDFLSYCYKIKNLMNSEPSSMSSIRAVLYCMVPLRSSESFVQLFL